jgi:hypothetical protein
MSIDLVFYGELLDNLKTRIRRSQLKANLAVNAEMILLYWDKQTIVSKEKSIRKDGEECGNARNFGNDSCGFLRTNKRTQNKRGERIDTNPIERIRPRDSEIGMIHIEMNCGLVKCNAPIPKYGGDRRGQRRSNQGFARGFQLDQLEQRNRN